MEKKREAVVTDHAGKRAKKRLGIGKSSAQRISQKAFEDGITHAEAKGKLKKYIDGLYLLHGKGNNIRVYHQKVYLFQGSVLITILNLPNRYVEAAQKIQKRKKAEKELEQQNQTS